MASIPPLSSFRSARRGPRLRGGRSAPRSGEILSEEELEKSRDTIIQQTDNDATSSRMSAVALGYLDDQYAKAFFPQGQEVPKRYPIINRGTQVRTQAIDKLVSRFLERDPARRKQVISLGAGSDTRFFRLCAGKHNVIYHEIDFEENVIPKRTAIRESKDLARMTLAEENGSSYHLHALDLRDLTKRSPPIIPGLESETATLILSECCLCYLPPDMASSVLQYFTMNLKHEMAIVLYEPIRPYDAFGKTMVTNLSSRGIELRTLKRYYSLGAQRQRLRLAGFQTGQGARDVHQIWSSDEWVSKSERERIEKLEWLDEVEEWKLLASHYCVAWGWRGEGFGAAWSDIAGAATSEEAKEEELM
ncbi:related to Leucine carboxyl methyltransferase 1 [Ramularia collo-cygni]|uniref:Leucine carboxyl methyltransferase 1 n=1 Tax=Ramularia collo-cygni TaxID=112498 RepID=A0A2D3V2R6_9PEZI|nr:related to Leucine carboxyl methyltransferase 1 [Ramularia collo-cygni]CZT14563.1 related to Leucine carboxyl methyltransferase 1 [Ramularia collo-cygni]